MIIWCVNLSFVKLKCLLNWTLQKLYLVASLQSLCKISSEKPLPPASLLTTHLKLISSPSHPSPPSPTKILKFARKYTTHSNLSPELWLVRLGVEQRYGEEHVWSSAWEEARKVFLNYRGPDEEKRLAIWTCGLDQTESWPIPEQIKIHEVLIKESILAEPSSSGQNILSDTLLTRYIKLLYARSLASLHSYDASQSGKGKGKERQSSVMAVDIRRIAQLYLPSARVWDAAFDIYSGASTLESGECSSLEDWQRRIARIDAEDLHVEERLSVLRTIFDRWRLFSTTEHCKAATKWGAWLLLIQKRLTELDDEGMKKEIVEESGKEAARVIANARTVLTSNEQAQFEKDWRKVLDYLEGNNERGSSEEDGEDIIMLS